MLKVVLDTNQFVSALISKQGPPAQLVQAWRERVYLLAMSKPLQKELERVLGYERLRRAYDIPHAEIHALFALIEHEAIMVPDPPSLTVIVEDPDDNHVLACAVAVEADYIVSGDQHLLGLRRYEGIEIVTARHFLTYCLKR